MIGICGCEIIVETFMVSVIFIIMDKHFDLLFKTFGIEVVF